MSMMKTQIYHLIYHMINGQIDVINLILINIASVTK